MLSSKPICKDKIVFGPYCKLCPNESKCCAWKNLFMPDKTKEKENKTVKAIVVGS